MDMSSIMDTGTTNFTLEGGICSQCIILSGRTCQQHSMELRNLQTTTPQGFESNSDAMRAFREHRQILQCQNNALQDPFNKLPPELLCRIFRKIRTTTAEEVVALVSICKRWREVILGDPRFWKTLRIPCFRDDRFGAKQIEQWLALSNGLPLSIVFNQGNPLEFRLGRGETLDAFQIRSRNAKEGARRASKVVVDALMAEKGRIRSIDATYLKGFLECMVQTMEPTTTTPHAAWSMLISISIDAESRAEYVIKLLQCCPRIKYLKTRHIMRSGGPGPELEMMRARDCFIRLPHLKAWSVSFVGKDDGVYPAALFDHLETPALEKITYKSEGDSALSLSALEKLFRRSACAITTLHIQFATFTRESLVSLLRSQPSLLGVAIELHHREGTMHTQSREEVQATFDAFKDVMQLLIADREAEMAMDVGENITEGRFLPNLETFEHIGEMHYPFYDLADLYDVQNDIWGEWQEHNGRTADPDNASRVSSPPTSATRPRRPFFLVKFK